MTLRGEDYDARIERLAAGGAYLHGEADLVCALLADPLRRPTGPVLDAGCGTGRVAIELARRGTVVEGVDVDPGMLAVARAKAPEIRWVEGDLADFRTERRFALTLAAGNVMVFTAPGSEAEVVGSLARTLEPGGLLVVGFQLDARLPIARYDEICSAAGLTLVERWATWERAVFAGGDYAVSLHRLGAARTTTAETRRSTTGTGTRR